MAAHTNMRRRRILLIEDNPDTAQSLMALLGSMGHEVQLAIDGASARRAARSSPVDMIVLDIVLRDCDGWELVREFRDEPGLAQAPIVAISGRRAGQASLTQL